MTVFTNVQFALLHRLDRTQLVTCSFKNAVFVVRWYLKEADYPAHGLFKPFLPAMAVAPSRYAANVALFPISEFSNIEFDNRDVYSYLLSPVIICLFWFACAIKEARGMSAQLHVTQSVDPFIKDVKLERVLEVVKRCLKTDDAIVYLFICLFIN